MLSKCWEEAVRGGVGIGVGEAGGRACTRRQPRSPQSDSVARVPLGHGDSGPAGSSSAATDSLPWTLAPSRPWPPCLQKQKPRSCARCGNYRLLLTPTVPVPAALGHGGLGTGGSEASSLSLRSVLSRAAGCWQREAPCPHRAQFAQTLRMLLWRWWEGVGRKGRRRRRNPAQHHKPEFTNTSVTPSYLSPPPT